MTVGSRVTSFSEARRRVSKYLNDPEYAWQHYDLYETNSDQSRLADGDLLAPMLLNVEVKPRSYALLKSWRPRLERALAALPEVALEDASDDDIARVAECYSVLSGPGMGVTLSKVLHRKHPALVPLYDRRVRSRYVPRPIERASRRTWPAFMGLLAQAMRADLRKNTLSWDRLCEVDSSGRLTQLRALDILAWWPEEDER